MRNRIHLLEQAQEKLNETIEMIAAAVKGNASAEAYLVSHLKILASDNHGFLDSSMNIDNVINKYREEEDFDEDDISDEVVERFED